MKQPIRMSLLENAYDFLNESLRSTVAAETQPAAWKFAILHVIQAIELLLKARLQAEHALLVYEHVDRPTRTVSIKQAVDRIESAAGVRLTPREKRSIFRAVEWRDEVVHSQFEFSPFQVEAVYVQLFEFLTRFHNEQTSLGELHFKIDEALWDREAELFEFFRREFVTYNGVEVIRSFPAQIVAAQLDVVVDLHGAAFERFPHRREPWSRPVYSQHPCGDCAVLPGQIHVRGCDIEVCPRCYDQFAFCGCIDGLGPPGEDLPSPEVAIESWQATMDEVYR